MNRMRTKLIVPDRFHVGTVRVRRAFKPVVQVGWNIAALIFGGRIQEARDIALFNDHEAGLAYMRKHQKEVRAKVEEMLSYPH